MSKQSEAKEKQGFKEQSNMCSNCEHFTLERDEYSSGSFGTYFIEENLRCTLGNFKVNKKNTCNEHRLIES